MGLVVALPLVARLATIPIRVRMLSPAEFGEVSLWAAIIAVLGGFGVWPATGLMRYLPAGTEADRAKVLRSWLALTVATAAIVACIFGGWALKEGVAWYWVAVVSALEIIVTAAASYSRALGRFGALAIVSLTASLGGLLAGTLLIIPVGPIGVLIGWAAADLAAVLLACGLLSPTIRAGLRVAPGWDLGRFVRFSTPLAVSNCTWMLVTWIDRPLLAGLVTKSELGLYSLAYALVAAPLAGLFVVLSSVTWNHAVTTFERDGYTAAAKLLSRSGRIYTATAVPAAVWLGLYGDDLLGVIAPSTYAASSRHVIWLAVGLWCFGLLPYRNQHLMLWNRSSRAAASALTALVANVIILRVGVPYIGVVGAAVATAGAYGVALGTATYLCRRDRRIESRLPVRLTVVCFAVSLSLAVLFAPVVGVGSGRLAKLCLLGAAGTVLVASCLVIEGTVWKACRSRLARAREALCAT